MRLVYRELKDGKQVEVKVGDKCMVGGRPMQVYDFQKPHKSSSEGKIILKDGLDYVERYVSVIGAEWIEREDR